MKAPKIKLEKQTDRRKPYPWSHDEQRSCIRNMFSLFEVSPLCDVKLSWKKTRVNVGLSHVRVHDIKHTFGRRLRAVEVSFEDRQDLLGHKSGRITTHYSQLEYSNLIRAANKVCDLKNNLVILNR